VPGRPARRRALACAGQARIPRGGSPPPTSTTGVKWQRPAAAPSRRHLMREPRKPVATGLLSWSASSPTLESGRRLALRVHRLAVSRHPALAASSASTIASRACRSPSCSTHPAHSSRPVPYRQIGPCPVTQAVPPLQRRQASLCRSARPMAGVTGFAGSSGARHLRRLSQDRRARRQEPWG
jgi:hypothetical protein